MSPLWLRAIWVASLITGAVAALGTTQHPFVWFDESFAEPLDTNIWDVANAATCFSQDQGYCLNPPCGLLKFASGSACYLAQTSSPAWTLPQGFSGSITVRVKFHSFESRGECCIGTSEFGVINLGFVQGTAALTSSETCPTSSEIYTVARENFFYINTSVSIDPIYLGQPSTLTYIMSSGDLSCPQNMDGDLQTIDTFYTTLRPKAGDSSMTTIDMTIISAFSRTSQSVDVASDVYQTSGPISWLRIGSANDGSIVTSVPQSAQIKGISVLLQAQCADGNADAGDGCSSSLVEPFWFCKNDGRFGNSLCYDATNMTELNYLNSVGAVRMLTVHDPNSIPYPYAAFTDSVEADVGFSTVTFPFSFVECVENGARACVDSANRRLAGAFINGTWTLFSTDDISFPTVTTATINMAPYGAPFYPGTTIRFVWWVNVVDASAGLGFVTLDGALLAASPNYVIKHIVPAVVSNSESAVPLVAPFNQQTITFTSNIKTPQEFEFWLYEGATTYANAAQFTPTDSMLKVVPKVECSSSGNGPFEHTCVVNVTAPTSKSQPGYLVARLTYSPERVGPILKLHPLVAAPEVDLLSLPLAEDAANGFTITGKYWTPDAVFALISGGVSVSATLKSNTSSTRTYELTSPMTVGDFQVSVSLYQYQNTFTIGTTRTSPPTVTNTGAVRYNLESTFIIINGSNFAELDPSYNRVILSQDDSNVPVCHPISSTLSAIVCEFNDTSRLPTEGTIYAQVSIFGGHYSARSPVGLYLYISSSWPYLIFTLNTNTGVPTLTSEQLATIRSKIATLLALSPTDLLIRVVSSQAVKRAVTGTADMQIYFTTATAQALFQSSLLSKNQTVQTAVNGFVADVSANSITSTFASGTTVIEAPPVAAPPPTENSNAAAPPTLSTGAIAGIAVAVVAIVAIVIVVVVIAWRRRFSTLNRLQAAAEKVPEEMRSMFSIKSADIELGKKLGEGSFGAVFQGVYRGKQVAVKKLVANVLSSQITEFFREASLMMGIKPHKNVVRTYGMCQEFGNFSMVLEFLEGGSLDGWLHKNDIGPAKPMDEVQLYKFARGIALGMRHLAHSHIVHRDLAARNILLGKDLTPKISDFGFSRVVGDDQQGKTQSTVGPIRWMSPENLSRQEYSEKSDVWSYGALLIELLTGKEPFPGEDILSVAVGVRDSKYTAIDFLPKGCPCPKWTMKLMRKCFTVVLTERPTFDGVIEFLDKCRPSGVPVDPQEDEPEQDIIVEAVGSPITTNKKKAAAASPAASPTETRTAKPANNYSGASAFNEEPDTAVQEANKTNKTPASPPPSDAPPKNKSGNYGGMPKDESEEPLKSKSKPKPKAKKVQSESSSTSEEAPKNSGTYGGLPPASQQTQMKQTNYGTMPQEESSASSSSSSSESSDEEESSSE